MFKKTIKVLISQLFNNQQIITENEFYLFGYKRCKRQLHDILASENPLIDIHVNFQSI